MWTFILIIVVVAVLLVLPLLTVGASYLHSLGEKWRDEQLVARGGRTPQEIGHRFV